MKKFRIYLFLLISLVLFFVSRIFILNNPPYVGFTPGAHNIETGYSDVNADYERYANFWKYGLTPYRKHLFEYPPGAIVFMRLPLEADLLGYGKYYPNYRTMIFGFEVVFFGVILATLLKLPIKERDKYLGVGFYILAGLVAKNFLYDGLDLVFFGSFLLGLMTAYLTDLKSWWSKLLFWILLWFSVEIKLVTLPLLLPIIYYRYKKVGFSEIKWVVWSFLITWGLPLILYRSSLSVFLTFHSQRGLKYGSFGNYIVEFINDYTKSEVRVDKAPDFAYTGPVSTAVKNVFSYLFYVVMAGFLMWSKKQIDRFYDKVKSFDYRLILVITLVFMFLLFLTSKTFSSPFHIWYIGVLATFPFLKVKNRWIFYLLALWLLVVDTSSLIKFQNIPVFGLASFMRIRDFTRFFSMFTLLMASIEFLNRKKLS